MQGPRTASEQSTIVTGQENRAAEGASVLFPTDTRIYGKVLSFTLHHSRQ